MFSSGRTATCPVCGAFGEDDGQCRQGTTRDEIDALQGPTLLEFGASWCPHCIRAQAVIATALARHPRVRHLKIEDGKGRRLGRSYKVKLWPTLIFVDNGEEAARLVRPAEVEPIADVLDNIDPR